MRFNRCTAAAALLAATGCASVKPIARTVNDVARELCAMYFSEQEGISAEDAARTVCNAREVLDPFIREVLQAKQAAGHSALAGMANNSTDAGVTGD